LGGRSSLRGTGALCLLIADANRVGKTLGVHSADDLDGDVDVSIGSAGNYG
jgi:hypothetical protein